MLKLLSPDAERISARGTPRRLDGGFTLTELVVTIAIAGILAALAVPSFNNVIAIEHAKAAASELYASLFTARAEAIRLDKQIVTSAATGGWNNGWSTAPNGGGTTLDSHGAAKQTVITEASGATTVTYYPSGRLAVGVAPKFVISARTGNATSTQCVSINPTGTPYMKAGSAC